MAISGPSSALYATHNHVHVLSAIISLCRPSSGQCYAPRQVFLILCRLPPCLYASYYQVKAPPLMRSICHLLSGLYAARLYVHMMSIISSTCRLSSCLYTIHHRIHSICRLSSCLYAIRKYYMYTVHHQVNILPVIRFIILCRLS